MRRRRGSVTVTLDMDTSGFQRAIELLREATERLAYIARGAYHRQRWFLGTTVPHAFTPDFDLRCTVPMCVLGPEDHR